MNNANNNVSIRKLLQNFNPTHRFSDVAKISQHKIMRRIEH